MRRYLFFTLCYLVSRAEARTERLTMIFPMKTPLRAAAYFLITSLAAFGAELDFSPGFSPAMVIQRDAEITVTGHGPAGEEVKVSFAEKERTVKVDEDGNWKLDFPEMMAGGPYILEVSDGKSMKTIPDILIGDVWIFSGQSNMQMGLDEAQGGTEAIVSGARDSQIRLLVMPKAGADTPQSDPGAAWQKATPESLRKFSAVAGFFALAVHEDPALAKVPLGIVDTSFGGTSVEAWTPKGTLPGIPPEQISGSMFGIPPGNLFNRMISPLTSMRVKGVAWYQGEANSGQPGAYAALLKNMIGQWRKQWNEPELPFFIVQLPAYEGRANGLDFSWLREAQARACQESKRTWLAATYDTTDGMDLHPVEKKEVGRRLALLAEREVYGKNVTAHGPSVSDVVVEGDRVIVSFDEVVKPSKGGKILGFSLAGADGEYRFSDALSAGNKVVLKADGISEPKTLRYAWSGLTDANLVNTAGLPVAPFRTDTLPPHTLDFRPLPTVYRLSGKSYQMETSSSGGIASLIVGGKQFLSAEPGGGTSIPGFFGPRGLPNRRMLGPDRIEFSDNSTRLEIHCTEESMEWKIQNDGKDGMEFHIALAESVQVSFDSSVAGISRGDTKLSVGGIDHVADGKLVAKIQPQETITLRFTLGANL